jgi:hypothetical protein
LITHPSRPSHSAIRRLPKNGVRRYCSSISRINRKFTAVSGTAS